MNELSDSPAWFRTAVTAAIGLKEHIVAARGVGEDVLPFLDLRSDGSTRIVSLPVHARRSLAIPWAIATYRPQTLTLIDEAYRYIGDGTPDVLMRDYRHGDLAQRFAAGDRTVAECLMIVGSDGDSVYQMWLPYRYDGRTVDWLDPDRELTAFDKHSDTLVWSGDILEALQTGFEMMASDYPQAKAHRKLRDTGAQVKHMDAFIEQQTREIFRASRNEPCPCGSGRKFKLCHG